MSDPDLLEAVRDACRERLLYWRSVSHPRARMVPDPLDEVGLSMDPKDGRLLVSVPAAESGLSWVYTVPPESDPAGRMALVELCALVFLESGMAMLGVDDGSAPH